jgi:hypothetical protein
MAEALAPGQSEELLQVAQLGSNSKDVRTFEQTLDNEIVENLKQVYKLYVEQKMAHVMHDEQEYMLKRDSEPSIRQRADPEKIKHFVNWLVESNTLVSGDY